MFLLALASPMLLHIMFYLFIFLSAFIVSLPLVFFFNPVCFSFCSPLSFHRVSTRFTFTFISLSFLSESLFTPWFFLISPSHLCLFLLSTNLLPYASLSTLFQHSRLPSLPPWVSGSSPDRSGGPTITRPGAPVHSTENTKGPSTSPNDYQYSPLVKPQPEHLDLL